MRELIVQVLSGQPGIEIVGEVSADAEIPARVNQTLPDLVVIALEEPGKRPYICDTILRDHPELRILAVASQQNRTVCYWASRDIHSEDVEPSEEGILNAVRSIAQAVN